MHPDGPGSAGRARRGPARAGLLLFLGVLASSLIAPRSPAMAIAQGSAARATPAGQVATVLRSAPDVVTSRTAPAAAQPRRAPVPAATRAPHGAAVAPLPTSQHGYHFRGTVVPMRFPLPSAAKYAYANDFLAPRVGVVYPYEHARGRAADGTLLRAHDGVDVHVAVGTPVLAPFSGTVVDPATRWRPWDRARYGLVAVVVSDEPVSRGYAVLLVHLSRLAVRPGQHVVRGQILGLTGQTGNADGTPPHLHVELRAPFLLVVHERGIVRRIDAFDPYPSLVAADPHR